MLTVTLGRRRPLGTPAEGIARDLQRRLSYGGAQEMIVKRSPRIADAFDPRSATAGRTVSLCATSIMCIIPSDRRKRMRAP